MSLNLFDVLVTTYAGRVVSTFGQPNFYAGFLLFTLPFSYYLLNSKKIATRTSFSRNDCLRIVGWGSGFISMIGIIASYSRLAILLTLILLSLTLISQLKAKFKLRLVVLIVGILIALSFSSRLVINEFIKPFKIKSSDLNKESVEKRVYIWPIGLKVAFQKPLTGYGLENIGTAFVNYFKEQKQFLFEENLNIFPILIRLKDLTIDRSHNYMLDLLLFSGILGLLGYLGLLGALFKKLRQKIHDREQNVLLVSLITYLVWVQFQNQSVVHLIFFWLLVGLI